MKIVLGITGAISCYKVCSLVRLMVQAGWEVRVVATDRALDFVGEITWRTLSQHKVERDAFEVQEDWHPRHIELASWADGVLIAPCSANTLARITQGMGGNLLEQVVLAAANKPLWVAPSMNVVMWQHAAVQANVETLVARGVKVLSPGEGELACGVSGTGRLPEPEDLFEALKQGFLG